MPPLRLNLPERVPRPAATNGIGHVDNDAGAKVGRSSAVVGAGTLGQAPFSGAWSTWPLLVMNAVHITVKGWFTRLDAVLLGLPRGLGPAVSSLVRVLSLMIAASIVSSIMSKTASDLLKLPSRASKAVADPSSYTPGRHTWEASPSRWDPHYCSICSEAIAWVSDSGVKCQICGSHAHVGCSKRAHKDGLACKALCSADVEVAHKRLFNPLEEEAAEDDDVCVVSLDVEEKPPPIMRHQWMRGSIDDSQPCSGCGGSCAGGGATGQHGFSCAWCKLQVHEGCAARMSETECTLGRHRRLILPPIAVLKNQPPRRGKGGLIREAVSKVRSVLPGHREDECEPPSSPQLCVDPNDPSSQGLPPQQQQQQQHEQLSFVEAVREAAATAASEVGLDVDAAKAGGRRLAEKVRDAIPTVDDVGVGGSSGGDGSGAEGDGGGIDGVWGEALGGRAGLVDGDNSSGGPPGVAANAKIDGIWDAALTSGAAADDAPVEGVGVGGAATAEGFIGGVFVEGEDEVGEGLVAMSRGEEDRGWSGRESLSSRSGVEVGRGDVDGGDGALRGESVDAEGPRGGSSPVGVGGGGAGGEVLGGEEGLGLVDIALSGEEKGQRREDEGDAESEREMISSEYASMEAGVLRAWDGSLSVPPAVSEDGIVLPPPATPVADATSVVPAGSGDGVVEDEEVLRLDEPSVEAGTVAEGVAKEAVGVEGNGTEFQQVGGVGVAGWGGGEEKEDEGRQEMVEEEIEVEEEVEEEKEPEWRVKMQELYANFQSAGDGPDATKTVSYSRKTRSVRLTICEENIPDDSCPLLVFVNSKSGGKQGGVLLSRFRALLNPLQVADLSQEDPLEVLQRFRHVPNLRLLACGGDGTVAWLLQAVDAVTWKEKRPPLAVLPLGTGNDLARVLGWGGGYVGEDLENLLDTIENAQVTMLDRWSVSVVATGKGGFRKGQKDRQLIMNNYLGIGVDGQVALDFHKMREARPVLFFNRAVNKALYAQLGARSALVRACHDLPSKLELRCDGQLVELPETTASIIALNINSYGGGSKLWAVEERNRRAWAGRTSNHPLSYPQTQTTMWGFDTSGLDTQRGSSIPSGTSPAASPAGAATAAATRKFGPWARDGRKAGERTRAETSSASGEIKAVERLRAGVGNGIGNGSQDLGRGEDESGDGAGGSSQDRGAGAVGGWVGWEAGSGSDSESGEGRWGGPRDSRGSSSVSRESKTSFHDGVLEVVAVEGVFHLGQIQLGLSRALAVAQCREMQVRTSGMLPMQVDGEPWKQQPSEITVKLHNQAAMLRPATLTERAVASVLNDVSSAITTAEEDMIINERQARTLISRIRRSARLP